MDEKKIYDLEQKDIQFEKDCRKNNQNMRLPGFDSTDQEDDQVIEEDDDIVMNTQEWDMVYDNQYNEEGVSDHNLE